MPDESSVATLQSLVHVHAGKPMSHLLSIMVCNDFEVVPFIAVFHFLKQCWNVVEWLSHLWRQFVTICLCEAFEFRGIHFERLELQLSLERPLQLCLSFFLSPTRFLRFSICIIFCVCIVVIPCLECSTSSDNSRLNFWSILDRKLSLTIFLVHWWQRWHTVTFLCTLLISCWLRGILFFCHNRTFNIQFLIPQFHWRFALLTIDIFYKIRVWGFLFLVYTEIFLICLGLCLLNEARYSLFKLT